MKIKSLVITAILLTSTIWSQAQQINAVPDYVFRNQMSVGRNAVTDTAAYFSIGPRYGATKGFMPPIVGDTATFSSGKRNGLLIFSVQKNKFLYWDSVRVQWSDMAGSSGAYIVAGDTASMLAPYLRKVDTTSMLTAYLRKGDTTAMLSPYYRSATASAALALKLNISDTSSMLGNYVRHAGYGLTKSGQSFLVDTLNIATRAWRQKGLDSLAALEVSGSGTTNYIPKFTAGSTIGNSQIFDNGTSVGIGTSSPLALLHINGSSATAVQSYIRNANGSTNSASELVFGTWSGAIPTGSGNPGPSAKISAINVNSANASTDLTFTTYNGGGTPASAERMRITSGGDVGIGTTSPSTLVHVQKNQNAVTTLRVENTDTTSSGARANISVKNVDVDYHITSIGKTGAGINAAFAGTNSNHTLYLMTNGTARQTIFANGRIGINTTTDAGYQLDINGTLRSVNGANFATNGTSHIGMGVVPSAWSWPNGVTQFRFGGHIAVADNSFLQLGTNSYYDGSNYVRVNAGYASRYLQNDGGHFWSTAITSTAGSTVTFNEQMRMTRDGELLINTTSDAGDYKLQVSGNIYNTGSAVLAATGGTVGIGATANLAPLTVYNPTLNSTVLEVRGGGGSSQSRLVLSYGNATTTTQNALLFSNTSAVGLEASLNRYIYFSTGTSSVTERMRITSDGELILDASGTDAGDYKLQVVGNARVGTGKLDIASNTTFGLGVARSGTSEVAGQIYNSNGILYLGAESSAGGQIFSGSSAYAGVIGTGANYPLQFAVNNITRGGFSTSGNLLLGFTTDSYFLKLQVNGSIFSNNQFFGQGANAQLSIDSSTNISPLYVSAHSLTGTSAQAMLYSNTTWNTTGNPSLLDLNITNTASGATSNYIKITDGTNTFRVTKAAEVVTAAPSGGSIKPWKLGEAATVSPTSPNRTIRVEIDGTVYYLHAKTTND